MHELELTDISICNLLKIYLACITLYYYVNDNYHNQIFYFQNLNVNFKGKESNLINEMSAKGLL